MVDSGRIELPSSTLTVYNNYMLSSFEYSWAILNEQTANIDWHTGLSGSVWWLKPPTVLSLFTPFPSSENHRNDGAALRPLLVHRRFHSCRMRSQCLPNDLDYHLLFCHRFLRGQDDILGMLHKRSTLSRNRVRAHVHNYITLFLNGNNYSLTDKSRPCCMSLITVNYSFDTALPFSVPSFAHPSARFWYVSIKSNMAFVWATKRECSLLFIDGVLAIMLVVVAMLVENPILIKLGSNQKHLIDH